MALPPVRGTIDLYESPEGFIRFYSKRKATTFLPADTDDYKQFRLNSVSSLRGFKFWHLPYFSEWTGQLRLPPQQRGPIDHTSVERLTANISRCAVQGIHLADITVSDVRTARRVELYVNGVRNPQVKSCWICQQLHEKSECHYNCLRCISHGAWREGNHQCQPVWRLSNVSPQFQRCIVLRQLWEMGEYSKHEPLFRLRRALRFTTLLPGDPWLPMYHGACAHFHGQVRIMDNYEYEAWETGLKRWGSDAIPLPMAIQFPFREFAFVDVAHSIDILDKIYIPAIRERQATRYECGEVKIYQRRAAHPQRVGARLQFRNMQPRVDSVICVDNYDPDNELHVELGESLPGLSLYVFPSGYFEQDDKGALKIPTWAYLQTLKEIERPRVVSVNGEDSWRMVLVTDSLNSTVFDFSDQKDYQAKKRTRALFQSFVDNLEHTDAERRRRLMEIFEASPSTFVSSTAHVELVHDLLEEGVDPQDFLLVCYDMRRPRSDGSFPKRTTNEIYAGINAKWSDVPGAERHLKPILRGLANGAPELYSPPDALRDTTEALRAINFDVDFFKELAYVYYSYGLQGSIDVGFDEGLREITEYRRILGDYEKFASTPEKLRKAGIIEPFGGSLRALCECFMGGPPLDDGIRQYLGEKRFFGDSMRQDPEFVYEQHTLASPKLQAIDSKDFIRVALGFTPTRRQQEALRSMCERAVYALSGPPGTGKTKLQCAAMIHNAYYYGERILVLTETNEAADDIYLECQEMLRRLQAAYDLEMREAEASLRAKYHLPDIFVVMHHLSAAYKDNQTVEQEAEERRTRTKRTDGRNLPRSAMIMVSTWGHATAYAIMEFPASAIFTDETARSTLMRTLCCLLQRSLNTSATSSCIEKHTREGLKYKVQNATMMRRLVMIGDCNQGLPRLLKTPIFSKKTSWMVGEYNNIMSCLMQIGAASDRLTESYRGPYYTYQLIFDRFQNYYAGAFKDVIDEVVAVRNAPPDVRTKYDLPQVGSRRLRCSRLQAFLRLDRFKSTNSDASLNFRHLVLRTNGAESYQTELMSQQNPWHRYLVVGIVKALLADGEILDERGVPTKVKPSDILVMCAYKAQVNLLRKALKELVSRHGNAQPIRVISEEDMRIMTMEVVQGLQSAIVVTDFVRHERSDFLCGHASNEFQTHHNAYYSVGLTRSQVTQLTLAVKWNPVRKTQVDRQQEGYENWMNRGPRDPIALRCSHPGDRIPLVPDERGRNAVIRQVLKPMVDFIDDNEWLFFAFSEKFYDGTLQAPSGRRGAWTTRPAFNWTRGVGCIPMPPPAGFDA